MVFEVFRLLWERPKAKNEERRGGKMSGEEGHNFDGVIIFYYLGCVCVCIFAEV